MGNLCSQYHVRILVVYRQEWNALGGLYFSMTDGKIRRKTEQKVAIFSKVTSIFMLRENNGYVWMKTTYIKIFLCFDSGFRYFS